MIPVYPPQAYIVEERTRATYQLLSEGDYAPHRNKRPPEIVCYKFVGSLAQ